MLLVHSYTIFMFKDECEMNLPVPKSKINPKKTMNNLDKNRRKITYGIDYQ